MVSFFHLQFGRSTSDCVIAVALDSYPRIFCFVFEGDSRVLRGIWVEVSYFLNCTFHTHSYHYLVNPCKFI